LLVFPVAVAGHYQPERALAEGTMAEHGQYRRVYPAAHADYRPAAAGGQCRIPYPQDQFVDQFFAIHSYYSRRCFAAVYYLGLRLVKEASLTLMPAAG
jgi:hypothetical protein